MGYNNTALLISFILVIALAFKGVTTAPVHRRSIINNEDAHRYLKQYGYMTADKPTGNEFAEGMVAMQRFFNLTETGQLDSATINMMSRPRCGIADINPQIVLANCTPGDQGTSCRRRRYTLLGEPWDSTSLTYRFNNYTPDLRRTQIRSAIERALGVWADVSPLSFTRIQDGTSFETASDIEIVFGAGSHGISHPSDGPFDGSSNSGGTVLAHAFNPGTVRYADLRGDMHFDEDEVWQEAAGIDLFTVAAHEFGHSLGLGHSNIRGALMFPTYYGYNAAFQLHEDDIQGIQVLYGPRTTTQNPTTPTPAPTTLPTKPRSTTYITATKTQASGTLDTCDAVYDTTATLYDVYDDVTTIAIKDQRSWRFATRDTILQDAFANAGEQIFDIFWRDSSDPLSALLEKYDGSLVVIRGTRYWEYYNTAILKPTFPQRLSILGLPENVEIMAALSKRQEDKIFLFSSFQYWTFDGNLVNLETGSPRLIQERWPGVPSGFNAAFSWQENSCFIKDKYYWCFNETASQVGSEFPRLFSVDWLGCDPDPTSHAPTINGYCLLIMISFCLVVVFWQK